VTCCCCHALGQWHIIWFKQRCSLDNLPELVSCALQSTGQNRSEASGEQGHHATALCAIRWITPQAWQPCRLNMEFRCRESYRVIKKGGLACMIGPVHPTFFISRFFADMWMLFPTEQEYIDVSCHVQS
jgi:hypothetical protein